jgi:serine-type D-Ala-D-Ala carboxypeptidase/endopeptidase
VKTALFALALAAALLTAACPASGAAIETTAPTVQTTDSDLYATAARYCQPLIDSGQQVGIVVGVIQGDRTLVAGFGRAKKESPEVPDGRTLFELASITKTFTAATLEVMIESSDVGFDDAVQQYLPATLKMPEGKARAITFRDLITHTSGLPNVPDDFVGSAHKANPRDDYTIDKMAAYLARVALLSPPGESYQYSSTGMGLVGLALVGVRKTSYEELIKSCVLDPLGMNDTCMRPSPDQLARLADGYIVTENPRGGYAARRTVNWSLTECFSGAGGLYSTADDMMKYMAANMGLGASPLVGTLERTQRPLHKRDAKGDIGMAWHIGTNARGRTAVFHGGNTWGYSCFMVFCRGSKAGVVILCNTSESVEQTAMDILTHLPPAPRP